MSTLLWIVLSIAYIALFVWLGLTTLRNGHGWLFFFGIFFPILWSVGALGGRGGRGRGRVVAATAAADLDRYCTAIGQLDAASNKIFAQLRQGGQISSDQLATAEKRFLQQNGDTIDELQQVAPEEIRADLATSIEASRVRAGLASGGPSAAEEAAAAQRVREFRKQNCPSG